MFSAWASVAMRAAMVGCSALGEAKLEAVGAVSNTLPTVDDVLVGFGQ